MAEGVSLTGLNVSIYSAGVSLTQTSTGMAAFQVSVVAGVSLSGSTTGTPPTPPPPGQGPKYHFFVPGYSYYITTTAF